MGDGAITSARLVKGRLQVIVTPGSAVGFYGKRPPGASIGDSGRFVRRRRYTDAVIVENHHPVSFHTVGELRVEPLKRVRIARGIGRPLHAAHGSLLVDDVPRTEGGGAAEIGPDDPLHVSGTIARLPARPLEIEIDGRPVKGLTPAKQFHILVEKQVTQSLGKHFIELVTMSGRRRTVPASDTFDVENSDDEPLSASRSSASLTLACSVPASAGQPISTVGRLSPALAGSLVSITYTENGTSVTHCAVVAPDGSYADSLTSGAGQVTVASAWAGNAEYLPTKSSACAVTVTAAPAPTSVSLACPGKATVKGPPTVTGSMSPIVAGATITVTYAEPNGTIVDQTTTDAQGSFTDMTTAVSSGTWSVSASYGGSAAFAGSSSAPCTTAIS